jgi:transcriptional regulator with XRE-family HTH domain
MAHAEEERKALGVQLAMARAASGLTLDAAAAELSRRGYPLVRATIGAWEKGRNLPDALWLRRLARLYDTTADFLVGQTDTTFWPFTDELRKKVLLLSDEELARAEDVLRAHLGLPQQTGHSAQRTQKTPYVVTDELGDTRAKEVGTGLPKHLAGPEPQNKHASRQKHRGSAPEDSRGDA